MTTTAPLEADFQRSVVDLAERCGWRCYHVANVRRHLRNETARGFPDLCMTDGETVVFAELKRGPRERPTADQRRWLDLLEGVGYRATGGVRAYVWRPDDWPEIERVLTRGRAS